MYKKRKEFQELILHYVREATNEFNVGLFRDHLFDKMDDGQFHKFMEGLRDGELNLSIVFPPGDRTDIDLDKVMKLSESLGFVFYEHLRVTGDRGLDPYITPNKYIVYLLPDKRTSQLAMKKMSVAKDDKKVNQLTGQVTGSSRSARITKPEVELLSAMGLENVLVEVLKDRGGDTGSKDVMMESLIKTGSVSRELLDAHSTGVESAKTADVFFRSAHIRTKGLVNNKK